MEPTQTTSSHGPQAARGVLALLCAFGIWGVLPLYLRLLRPASPLLITACRLLFCCVFALGLVRARGAMAEVRLALRTPGVRSRLLASAALISVNWLGFVWAVSIDHVVEASLGYFINPLVNVLLGVIVLGERLRPGQWFAVALAAIAVLYLGLEAHAAPWIALLLALSFGSYGLVRKLVAVDAMAGLATETLLVAPIGLGYWLWAELNGQGMLHLGAATQSLLVLSGLFTMLPLWLFAYGARRVRYSTVGLFQFTGPSISLAIGVLVFREPFPPARGLGFALLWLALLLYACDGLLQRRRLAAPDGS
jgi:chloramphenicol-sensitive protein RarD